MTKESENKLARRVDDKRADVPLQWNEGAGLIATGSITAVPAQPAQREVPAFTGLDALARVFSEAENGEGKVVLSAQSCDLLYRAMTTPIVSPIEPVVPAGSVVQDAEAQLYRDLTGDAMKLGYDGIPAALEALRQAAAAPAAQAQAELSQLHNAIMNLPCNRTMSHFATTNDMRAYKEGHRDARHAAAELAIGFKSDVCRSAAREQARIAELEAQLAECVALSQKWAAAAGEADRRAEQARNEALEEAAKICDAKYIARVNSGHPREASTARNLAEEIRALKAEAPAASKEGDDRG